MHEAFHCMGGRRKADAWQIIESGGLVAYLGDDGIYAIPSACLEPIRLSISGELALPLQLHLTLNVSSCSRASAYSMRDGRKWSRNSVTAASVRSFAKP